MLGLFKKRKDVLVVILTSSDVKRARRAYESVKNSPKHVSMDIEIIVNSLNKNYRAEVEKEFANDKVKITETESNKGLYKLPKPNEGDVFFDIKSFIL